MTSKNLFFKLMLENMKRRIWTLALGFLVFFFTLPVAEASCSPTRDIIPMRIMRTIGV